MFETSGNWYDLFPQRLYGSFEETGKTWRKAASHLLKYAVKVPKTHTCCIRSVLMNPVIVRGLVAFLKLLFAFWNAALVVCHVLSLQTIPRSFVVSYRTQLLTRLEHAAVRLLNELSVRTINSSKNELCY